MGVPRKTADKKSDADAPAKKSAKKELSPAERLALKKEAREALDNGSWSKKFGKASKKKGKSDEDESSEEEESEEDEG